MGSTTPVQGKIQTTRMRRCRQTQVSQLWREVSGSPEAQWSTTWLSQGTDTCAWWTTEGSGWSSRHTKTSQAKQGPCAMRLYRTMIRALTSKQMTSARYKTALKAWMNSFRQTQRPTKCFINLSQALSLTSKSSSKSFRSFRATSRIRSRF